MSGESKKEQQSSHGVKYIPAAPEFPNIIRTHLKISYVISYVTYVPYVFTRNSRTT